MKKRGMRSVIYLLLVGLLLISSVISCTSPTAQNPEVQGTNKTGDPQTDTPITDKPTQSNTIPGNNAPTLLVSEAYANYTNVKSEVVSKLMDGLSSNDATAMQSMSLLGVVMVDLTFLPVAYFGLGQETVVAGMSFLGMEGVTYSENGNTYSIKYNTEEGDTFVVGGTYDPIADALVTTGSQNGSENIYSEYHKTPFGYVGQYFLTSEDGGSYLYQIAISGTDGVIGTSTVSSKPTALSGNESADFPKSCDEWYAINGSTISGKTSDGTAFNFEYVPSPSE